MDISVKKSRVENRTLAVVTKEEYETYPEMYRNTGTAVQFGYDGKEYNLPHRACKFSEDRPGVYNCGAIDVYVTPGKENESDFTNEIIDFSDVENIRELCKKLDRVKEIEREILTSPDSIFTPSITETDSPEMKGLKEAVIAKHIDIDKYQDRFGDNFPNDKRQFKKDNITLYMLRRMCNCLDMKAKLIIEDADEAVPNPIGRPIEIDLTGGYEETED